METKRPALAFLLFLLPFSALLSRAQVAPTAYKGQFSLSAGAEGSMFQPDYAGTGVAETSPDRLYGVGTYVDARFTRWVQIEAEGRWLQYNKYAGIGENSYMIGPREPIVDWHGLEPYGKFLLGWGTGTGWLTGRAGNFAYGGGVDYRWKRRLTIRAIDFEYQQWRVKPTLWPYGGSVGVSYTIY
jgi:hypothetical protein